MDVFQASDPKDKLHTLNWFGSAVVLCMGSGAYVNHLPKVLQEEPGISRSNLTSCAHDGIPLGRNTLILFATISFPNLLDCLH